MSDSIFPARLLLPYPAWILFISLFLLFACSKETVEYEMGDKIELGPYIFSVEKTDEKNEFTRRGWYTVFVIYFRFHRVEKSPPLLKWKPFTYYIRDHAHNSFRSIASTWDPRGGRLVSKFLIDPDAPGAKISDPGHIGKHPSDFRLIIKNPSYQENQPRRVSVKLFLWSLKKSMNNKK